MSALCEVTGANVNQVSYVVGTNINIGLQFKILLPKRYIGYICECNGLPEVAEYCKQKVQMIYDFN